MNVQRETLVAEWIVGSGIWGGEGESAGAVGVVGGCNESVPLGG